MIDQEPFCDDQQLLRMLRCVSDIGDSAEMLDHVEKCEGCQHRLDELAAEESEWLKAVEVLSGNPDEAATAGLGVFQPSHLRQPAWTEAMARQLLSPPSHPEMLGRIGRYDVERLIGSGGMGVVLKAHDTELNRPVAVKLLAPYLASSGVARNRFAREARAAAAVVDVHVVAIHNVESDGEPPFLVMKYIAGGSLQMRLDHEGPLDVCEVLRIGMHTAKGLAAAHAQGLIHRDVKPSNILLDEGVDRALLTDFGLARAEDDAHLTRSGFHPGTPHYMSPEQVRGEAIDARSDLFGLGCVLYAMCTGHPPFRSETSYAVLRRITDDTPRPIREINPDVPAWLEKIVMKLLAKSPKDRFDSAEQVAEVLEDCLAHVQQPTTTPLPESLSIASSPRQRPPIGKLIAAAAFAFSLIFAGVLIVLELNKGTLTIECESDGIPIRIMQGDKIVEEMIVTKREKSTRIAAGNYVVEVAGSSSEIFVPDGGKVLLQRGGSSVVRITRRQFNDPLDKEKKSDTFDHQSLRKETQNEHNKNMDVSDSSESSRLTAALQGSWRSHYTEDKSGEDDASIEVRGDVLRSVDSDGDALVYVFSIVEGYPAARIAIREVMADKEISDKVINGIIRGDSENIEICTINDANSPPPSSFVDSEHQSRLHLSRSTSNNDATEVDKGTEQQLPDMRSPTPVFDLSDVGNDKIPLPYSDVGSSPAPSPTPWAGYTRPTKVATASRRLAALQSEHRKLKEAYKRAASQTVDQADLNRVRKESDHREIMPAKYLAFEEKHRGSDAGLKALIEVTKLAPFQVGDAESRAGRGRVVAASRVLEHYLDHHGLETHASRFSGRIPYFLQSGGYLQTLVEKSPHRETQAEALIAQVIQGKDLLRVESKLIDMIRDQKPLLAIDDDEPPQVKAELLNMMKKLEEMDFKLARADLNDKLKRLADTYFDVHVRSYGTGGAAAQRLSHAINQVIVGAEAPEIAAADINGQAFRLSKLRGKIVVLLFDEGGVDYKELYAPIRQLVAKYKNRRTPVQFVGIMSTDDPANLRAASKRGDLTWTVIPQPLNGPLRLDWGIETDSPVYIVSPEGILQPQLHMPYYGDGGYDARAVDDKIAELLRRPSPYYRNSAPNTFDHSPTPVLRPNEFDPFAHPAASPTGLPGSRSLPPIDRRDGQN